MAFYDNEHKKRIKQIEQLWQNLHALEELAKSYGINDIFQDNGAKILQQIIYMNMQIIPGREGNDAVSETGIEWEMKSINIETSASGFSTNHHTNQTIIEKYRKVPWSFAIYQGLHLLEIYVLSPIRLEPIYKHWEEKLKTMTHLNNPKIPIKFVRENGVKIYPITPTNPINPEEAVALNQPSPLNQ